MHIYIGLIKLFFQGNSYLPQISFCFLKYVVQLKISQEFKNKMSLVSLLKYNLVGMLNGFCGI